MIEQADLHGHWAIESWSQIYDDGRRVYPLGQALQGFIHYSADGRMACMIADAGRQPLSGGQFKSPDSEMLQAARGFFAYAGTYTIDGNVVSHQVEISLFPNWQGGVQKRLVEIATDTLRIEARLEEGTTEARTAVLAWRRLTTA